MRGTLFLILISCALLCAAQKPAPGAPQRRSVLVTGGTVHVGNGTTYLEGAVGFRDGRIDYVGYGYGVKLAYDTVIDVAGEHVYPGLILPDATLGLLEIDQVSATNDVDEVGRMEPEVRALSAYNTDSRIVPTVRANGVLLAQIVPRGGRLSGTSSIVQLDAWENADAAVVPDDGVHINWVDAFSRSGHWTGPTKVQKNDAEERRKELQELQRFFREARAYARIEHADVDLRMEAMRGLFTGATTLYVHADLTREIQEAVTFAREHGVQRLVIVGGYDAWRVADLLRDNKVDVILRRLHSLPMREDDDVDLPYRLPALLKAKGIRFCLGYAGDMERMGSRNLAFLAGTAAAHGLDREEALRAITLDAAAILGIDKRYGSLEVGKSATLFVSKGDALDMRTNEVDRAFIDGRQVTLDDHQKALYRLYRGRYMR